MRPIDRFIMVIALVGSTVLMFGLLLYLSGCT